MSFCWKPLFVAISTEKIFILHLSASANSCWQLLSKYSHRTAKTIHVLNHTSKPVFYWLEHAYVYLLTKMMVDFFFPNNNYRIFWLKRSRCYWFWWAPFCWTSSLMADSVYVDLRTGPQSQPACLCCNNKSLNLYECVFCNHIWPSFLPRFFLYTYTDLLFTWPVFHRFFPILVDDWQISRRKLRKYLYISASVYPAVSFLPQVYHMRFVWGYGSHSFSQHAPVILIFYSVVLKYY